MADTESMETEQPININITRGGGKEISEKYNKFKEYIIINNLELQSEVTALKDRICELTTELNEKELEEDKTDTRVRYLRGLVNNLNELKKGYLEISKNKETLVKETTIIWDNIYKLSEKYHATLLAYNIIFGVQNIVCALLSYTHFRLMLNVSINIIVIYTIVRTYLEYHNQVKNYKNDIKILRDTMASQGQQAGAELLKLEESTLSLDNWIYEV
jgi:hypothetical protein